MVVSRLDFLVQLHMLVGLFNIEFAEHFCIVQAVQHHLTLATSSVPVEELRSEVVGQYRQDKTRQYLLAHT